ncbi:MAG: hypothetical protein JSV21_01320 [Nitrospirota bacterium]|nr:MAG: hypothetical protein JSV21_01320 [Nitrospirota bacterium]
MKKLIAILFLLLFLVSCADKAAEMYDIAQFEELQNNQQHAIQIYREIIEKYPKSPKAKEADARIKALEDEGYYCDE